MVVEAVESFDDVLNVGVADDVALVGAEPDGAIAVDVAAGDEEVKADDDEFVRQQAITMWKDGQ